MRRIFSLVISLLAVVFIVMGVRWLIAPEGIAPEFGLILGDGLGLSSQIGDMSGYFLFLGISILLGVVTGHRPWFYAAAILLSLNSRGAHYCLADSRCSTREPDSLRDRYCRAFINCLAGFRRGRLSAL